MYIKFRENKPRKDHRGSDPTMEFTADRSLITDDGYLVKVYHDGELDEAVEIRDRNDLMIAVEHFIDRAEGFGFTQVDGTAMRMIYERAKMLPELESMEVDTDVS